MSHTAPITGVAFDMFGRPLTIGYDGRLVGWADDGRTPRWSIAHANLLNALLIGPQGQVVTTGADRTVTLLDLETGGRVGEADFGHEDDLNALALSPDGRVLAAAGEDGRIVLARFPSLSLASRELRVPACVNALAFVELGGSTALAVGGDDGHLVTFREGGGPPVSVLDLGSAIEALAPLGGYTVAAALEDGRVLRVDLGGCASPSLLTRHAATVKSLAVSRNRALASASYDGTIHVMSGDQRRVLAFEAEACSGWARALAFDPRSPHRLAVSSLSPAPQLWDTRTGKLLCRDPARTGGLNALEHGAGSLWTGGDSGHIHRLDPRSLRSEVLGHADALITSLAIDPGASWVATGALDGRLRTYSVAGGHPRASLKLCSCPINCVRAAASELLAGLYSGEVHLLDPLTLRPLAAPARLGASVKSVAFVGGEGRVAAGLADGRLVFWDFAQGHQVLERSNLELVNAVAWSEEVQRLASVGRDRVLRLWTRDGGLVAERNCHTRSVKDVSFDMAGHRLATTGYDGLLGVWDASRGLAPLHLEAAHPPPGAPAVRWLPDGRIATAGWDAKVRIASPEGAVTIDLTRPS